MPNFSPLFIGESSLTGMPNNLHRTVRNFSPLFIGESSLTAVINFLLTAAKRFQSPLHRGVLFNTNSAHTPLT